MIAPEVDILEVPVVVRPRLGFVGVGWIGRNRMEAMVDSNAVEVAAISDPLQDQVEEALAAAPDAHACDSLDELLEMDLDGIVIATPSALHAEQSIRALEAGMAVFCQKPLGRDAAETQKVVDAARHANRLLGVDLSYRFTAGMMEVRQRIASRDIGHIFAVDLVFHNAYGPGKDWFYDSRLSGGGCVIDLGIHMIDLLLWSLDFPEVESISSRLLSGGKPLQSAGTDVEDYAVARLDLASGATANLSCSWRLPAGCDAVIEATFYGTDGALTMRNIDGSYYDFLTERFDGRARQTLAQPPDAWGGRAAVDWAERLSESNSFDPSIAHLVDVACVMDRIYGRNGH